MNIQEIKQQIVANEKLYAMLKKDFVCPDPKTGELSCCTSAIIPENNIDYYKQHLPYLSFCSKKLYEQDHFHVQLTEESIRLIDFLIH
jgi:hypothetical protein